MKKILTLVLALAVSAPAFAQKMGGANRNAPKLQQSIMLGEAKMTLNYTSITWASGSMMETLADKTKGAAARKMVNDSAPKSPLAEFSTSIDVMVGEEHLPAGDYKVFFTVDDDAAWHINFMMGEKTHSMKLPLQPVKNEYRRLVMPLYAEEDGCGFYIAFGNHSCMLHVTPHKAEHK